ncbi:hypothetical protein [Streptomyces sp. NPDC055210]
MRTSSCSSPSITSPAKPAVLRGHDSDDHALRYMLMPARLTD